MMVAFEVLFGNPQVYRGRCNAVQFRAGVGQSFEPYDVETTGFLPAPCGQGFRILLRLCKASSPIADGLRATRSDLSCCLRWRFLRYSAEDAKGRTVIHE